MTTTAKVRTSWLQLSARHRQEALQHRMCRGKDASREAVPVQAPGMQRYRTQDVAWRDSIGQRVKVQVRYSPICNHER